MIPQITTWQSMFSNQPAGGRQVLPPYCTIEQTELAHQCLRPMNIPSVSDYTNFKNKCCILTCLKGVVLWLQLRQQCGIITTPSLKPCIFELCVLYRTLFVPDGCLFAKHMQNPSRGCKLTLYTVQPSSRCTHFPPTCTLDIGSHCLASAMFAYM